MTGPVGAARHRDTPSERSDVDPPIRLGSAWAYPERKKPESAPRGRAAAEDRSRRVRNESPLSLLGLLCCLVAVVIYLYLAVFTDRPALGGAITVPILLMGLAPIIRWVSRNETGFDLRGLLYVAFGLRALAAVPRWLLYANDSVVYHREGERIAAALRAFDIAVDTKRAIPGTGSVRYFSGIVHVAVFDDFVAAFLFFMFLSFVGICLFVRAFQIGVPDGDQRRYALLVCLLPSLLFWPSSLGKEALMIFTVGLVSYGIACMLQKRPGRGLSLVLIGLLLTTLVRPHIALMALVGVAATMFIPSRGRKGNFRFFGQLLAIVMVLVGGSFLARQTADLVSADDSDAISSTLDESERRSTQGDSEFTAARVNTPVDYPLAFVTVYFRPHPLEAHDVPALVNSMEAIFLVGLALASARRYRHLWTVMKRSKYVGYALVYVLAFAFAFSAIGNFGILVRQRTQALPLLLVLLALPRPRAGADDAERGTGNQRQDAPEVPRFPARQPAGRREPAVAAP